MEHTEFEARYSASVGIEVAELHRLNIWSRKCYCGCGGCLGHFMLHTWMKPGSRRSSDDVPTLCQVAVPIRDLHECCDEYGRTRLKRENRD